MPPPHRCRLLRFALRSRVHAKLADHQRFVAREVVQPREIARVIFAALQIHIHREEIGVPRHQILGGRIRRVAHEQLRSLGAGQRDQFFQRGTHPLRPHPAHERFFDLIADQQRRHAGERGQKTRRLHHRAPHRLPDRRIAQKIHVLRPRHAADEAQAVLLRRREHRRSREFMHAHRIEAQRGNPREIRVHIRRCFR